MQSTRLNRARLALRRTTPSRWISLGVGHGFPYYSVSVAPPDTNMAVGDTQVVQWVNVSYAVFKKSNGAAQTIAIPGNTLFSALGGDCARLDDGDIIAQWDVAHHYRVLTPGCGFNPSTV